jgi:uncharacterized membrane protein SpoIIM required for sporulation
LFTGIAGIGLWRLEEWGRRTAIALLCAGFVNSVLLILRPSVMQSYQNEVNRSMGIPQSQVLPLQFQSTIQNASLVLGIAVVVGVFAILHYYRNAFNGPSNPASDRPELIS